ncbi:hypothetical protein MB14_14660 [Roseivirga ehrenbergii]|uniref:Uncharacterized protein n=2 Tax=Roseivirga ehrenbergii (strain DSM 102268 / JCM 13514 / KCTC 12282 / NCIMB 14502 / KMM 6017) TaxID=279360 RepID=A0A150XQK9_ROSEK|nr:hypothetical protein MB14_14660 [Roseivirga ehrenbergii]
MLEKSLDLLFKNYNNQFRHKVLIFHEGDFKNQDQEDIKKGREEIEFHEVQFEIPSFLNRNEIPEKWDGIFGIGNRHMIRFYALQLFDILNDMGYDWFFRLDDDSFIHSRINYNLFEYMNQNGYDYGYRVDVKDAQRTCFGFSEMVLAYLKAERIKPHTFLDNFGESSKLNNEAFGMKGKIKRKLTKVIDTVADKINHDLNNWPVSMEWNRWGYYNNFFITRIGFWHQMEVQSFLHFLDRVGGGYKYRWTDLIVQTAAVQIFLPPSKIHKFKDWTYEHATFKNNKLDFGGIYPGEGDEENPEVIAFQKQFGKLRTSNSY